MRLFSLLLLVGVLMNACVSAPDYPIEPYIEFTGQSKNLMIQDRSNTDSVYINLSFTDGDGDIGIESDSIMTDIFVIDTRTGDIQDRFKTPAIPPEGTNNGVSGKIRLLIYTTCCSFPDGIPPCEAPEQYPFDTLSYQVYMVDRAGNVSNTIETDMIVLSCQ